MNAVKPVIVDYGAGNLRSVARAVARAGYEPVISLRGRPPWSGRRSVILPGVGAAADTMANLTRCGLVEPIRRVHRRRAALPGRLHGAAGAASR